MFSGGQACNHTRHPDDDGRMTRDHLFTPPGTDRRRPRSMAAEAATEPPSTSTNPAAAGGAMTEVLARKAKRAEVEAFKAALPRAHPIFEELDKVGWGMNRCTDSRVWICGVWGGEIEGCVSW